MSSVPIKDMAIVVTENPQIFISTLTLLFLPLVLYLAKRFIATSCKPKSPPFPPGPPAWPILGNLLEVSVNPPQALAKFSETLGSFFSVRLGNQLLVVANSHEAACEILRTHDRVLSGRFIPDMIPVKWLKVEHLSMLWAQECNDDHRHIRTLSQTHLFSNKAVTSQACIREHKAREMVRLIRKMEGKAINVKDLASAVIFSMVSNILMSAEIISLEEEILKGEINENIRESLALGATPNLSDVYPILAPFDLQGQRKKSKELFGRLKSMWDPIIRERRDGKPKRNGLSNYERDFLDILIEEGCTDEAVGGIFQELQFAGTDSSSITVEWTLTELINSPKSMKRLEEEIARKLSGDIVQESDLPRLTYLDACIKEGMRLHAPVPLLVPHKAIEDCVVLSHTIPKDSQIVVNAWAIGRDPKIWDDPLAYKPERFINSSIDFEKNNLEFIPFGHGRRACPGQLMGLKQVSMVLANLIHFFDLSLPGGGNPEDIDKGEDFHVTMPKKEPLLVIAKAKNH